MAGLSQDELPQLSNGHQHCGDQVIWVSYGVELVCQIDEITEIVEATPRDGVQGLDFSLHYQCSVCYKSLEEC